MNAALNPAAKDLEDRLINILTDAEGLMDLLRRLDDNQFAQRVAARLVKDIVALLERIELCRVEPYPEWHEAFGEQGRRQDSARVVSIAARLRARLVAEVQS